MSCRLCGCKGGECQCAPADYATADMAERLDAIEAMLKPIDVEAVMTEAKKQAHDYHNVDTADLPGGACETGIPGDAMSYPDNDESLMCAFENACIEYGDGAREPDPVLRRMIMERMEERTLLGAEVRAWRAWAEHSKSAPTSGSQLAKEVRGARIRLDAWRKSHDQG